MPDVALAEILRGLASEKLAARIETELREFEVINVGGRHLVNSGRRQLSATARQGHYAHAVPLI